MAAGNEECKLSDKLTEDLTINGVAEEIIEQHGQQPGMYIFLIIHPLITDQMAK